SAYNQFIFGTLLDPYNNDSQFTCPPHGGTPCNEIPNTLTPGVSNITDQAVAILGLLPPPNYTPTDPVCANGAEAVCNNYLASGQEAFNANQFDVRADYDVSSAFRVFGRYSFGQFYDNGAP